MASNGDNFFKGFVFGTIVGGILGVLFAPKSGKEMREDLSGETEKILARAKVDIENARKAAMHTFDESKDRIIDKLAKEKETPKEDAREQVKKKSSPKKTQKSTKRQA